MGLYCFRPHMCVLLCVTRIQARGDEVGVLHAENTALKASVTSLSAQLEEQQQLQQQALTQTQAEAQQGHAGGTCTHTQARTRTQTHTYTQAHRHVHAHKHTYTHAHTRAHTHTRTHTHKNIHTHTHTHKHTHTYTHTEEACAGNIADRSGAAREGGGVSCSASGRRGIEIRSMSESGGGLAAVAAKDAEIAVLRHKVCLRLTKSNSMSCNSFIFSVLCIGRKNVLRGSRVVVWR
jgi:hypothetical protein